MKKFGIRVGHRQGRHGCEDLSRASGARRGISECDRRRRAILCGKIKKVKGVDFLEFGVPEAMWHLQVDGFAAIVTMDSHGNSLHADVEKDSLEKLVNLKIRSSYNHTI